MITTLLQMNATLNDGLAIHLRSFITELADEPAKVDLVPSVNASSQLRYGKYSTEFLGEKITAQTLPEFFSQFVDLVENVAPEAVYKLATMRANKRRFVARTREAIHPARSDLPVMQTSSGWWISKNIGQEDLKRALKALADATGLKFGYDIKFPTTSQLR